MRNLVVATLLAFLLGCATSQEIQRRNDEVSASGKPSAASAASSKQEVFSSSAPQDPQCPSVDVSTTNEAPLSPYAKTVQQIVQSKWHVPEAQLILRQKGWVSISFYVQKDGTITDAKIFRASGIPAYDKAALAAITASSPLPPLPSEVTCHTISGVFRFFYNEKQ